MTSSSPHQSRWIRSAGPWPALAVTGLLLALSVLSVGGGQVIGSRAGGAESAARLVSEQPPPGEYWVNFTETGLTGVSSWSVTLNGVMNSAASSAPIQFAEGNGSDYPYTVGSIPGWSSNPSSGSVTVAGANQTVLPPISWSQDFYSLSFQQNTLPPGTGWWANVTGQPGQFSTGLTATYSSLPYATYTYAIASDNKVWNPSPSGGSVLLDTNKAIPITFTPVLYLVKFNEIGLPSGTEWWANVSGQSPLSTTGTSISTSLINGSYTYTISTTNKSYSAPGGPFTVAGGPVNNQVLFTQQAYTVAFVESGLKKGLFWNVTFLGLMQSSKSTIITFNSVPNGSYPFVIGALPGWIATPPNGTVVVRGAATDQTVVWSQLVYNVTVNVTGLAPPGRWWVNLTGPTGNSSHPTTGSSNVIALPNGTYAFTIASQDKSWEPNITKGSFLVNGAALEFSVTFVELVQPVTFTETGLPSGTEWWANLTGGHTNLSLGSTIGFQLPNGTYGYRVQAVDRTWAAVGGNVTVNGAPASVSVNFTNVLFLVQFNETGLPAGTTWSIILAGATNSTFAPGNNTFHEPNGTLPYTVGPVAG